MDELLVLVDFETDATSRLSAAFTLSERLGARVTCATTMATSANGGRLVNGDAPGIAYRLEIDGAAAELRAPLVLHRRPPPSLDGVSYPMRVTIGDADGAFAGAYRDVLTVDVVAM